MFYPAKISPRSYGMLVKEEAVIVFCGDKITNKVQGLIAVTDNRLAIMRELA